MSDSEKLEREALALVKKHGWLLPRDVKDFMRRLAELLGWNQLRGAL